MTPHDFEILGDNHKEFEAHWQHQLMPQLPFIVRLDGRSFHTFTNGLARPYDDRMTTAMIETMKSLVEEFHASVGFCQSDEITLVYKNSDPKQQMVFGGKVSKIVSTFAAHASVVFNEKIRELIPEKSKLRPIFDARVSQYPSLELATENLLWRETDATRNSVTMAAHAHFSHKELQKVSTNKKLDMLHEIGHDWNKMPSAFKRGTYARRVSEWRMLTEEEMKDIPVQYRPTESVVRSSVKCIELEPLESYTVESRIQLLLD